MPTYPHKGCRCKNVPFFLNQYSHLIPKDAERTKILKKNYLDYFGPDLFAKTLSPSSHCNHATARSVKAEKQSRITDFFIFRSWVAPNIHKDDDVWILGLTGPLGAGKSTIAKYLKQQGIPVHCSDKEIHALLSSDLDIQKKIKALWPEVFVEDKIDRNRLGNLVFFSFANLTHLESILYPKLLQRQKKFLKKHQMLKAPFVVLDVPLLCEMGLDRYCHMVLVATAPSFLRIQRVLRRKGMTYMKFQALNGYQMDEQQRLRHADFIIRTGLGKGCILKKTQVVLNQLSQQPIPKWQGKWPTQIKRGIYGTRNRIRH